MKAAGKVRYQRALKFAWLLGLATLLACGQHRSADASDAEPGASAEARGSAREQDSEAPLPAALKGYELYAWDEGSALHFTLTTGTNRQKTLSEIMTPAPTAEGSQFVAITSVGTDQLQRLLVRIPAGSPVVLATHAELPALSAASRASVEAAIAVSVRTAEGT